jgi:pimeloyl-ACP methyl ester carboxylesterase
MKVFVDAFTASGFTGGINWYRNMSANWQHAEGLDHTVRVPSLMIMAENDAVLPPSAADGMDKIIPDLEKYLVKGSGHWTQQEKPDEIGASDCDNGTAAIFVTITVTNTKTTVIIGFATIYR